MALTIVENDILSHVNPDGSLYQQVKLTEGCVTIFNEFGVKVELCWNINGNEVCVDLKFFAFVQSMNLGHACLTVGQSTKLNGHIDSLAKAEVEISIGSNLTLCFDAKVCVKPFAVLSWNCANTGKHCIHI